MGSRPQRAWVPFNSLVEMLNTHYGDTFIVIRAFNSLVEMRFRRRICPCTPPRRMTFNSLVEMLCICDVAVRGDVQAVLSIL